MTGDKRTVQRARFAAAVQRNMRKKHGIEIAVLDTGESWEVMLADGGKLTPEQVRDFWAFRLGYRLFGADV
jgi:hypothetical protein